MGERFGCLEGRPLRAVPDRPGEWWQAHNIQALNARLLHRAELSEADLFKLPCEAYSVMYICNQLDGISRPQSLSYAVKVALG